MEFLALVALNDRPGGSEVNLVLDFSNSNQALLSKQFGSYNVPTTEFEPKELESRQSSLPAKCPIHVPFANMSGQEANESVIVNKDAIFTKEELIPNIRLPRSVFVWARHENLVKVLENMELDVMRCKQDVNLGIFDRGTHFFFVTENRNDTETIFSSSSVSKHPYVAVFEIDQAKKLMYHWSYNFYHAANKRGPITLNSLYNIRGRQIFLSSQKTGHTFTSQKDMGGTILKVVSISYANIDQATYVPEKENKNKKFEDHWGANFDILKAMEQVMNFTVEYFNPVPIFAYGGINNGGYWDGSVGMVLYGDYHIVSDRGSDYASSQVLEYAMTYRQDYETFATPSPQPKLKILAFLSPFNYHIWLLVIASLVSFTMLLWILTSYTRSGSTDIFESS